jgi:hypothetical protein
MLLDVVLGDEMRHVCWVIIGVWSTVYRGVDKMRYTIFQCCVNELFPVAFFITA